MVLLANGTSDIRFILEAGWADLARLADGAEAAKFTPPFDENLLLLAKLDNNELMTPNIAELEILNRGCQPMTS